MNKLLSLASALLLSVSSSYGIITYSLDTVADTVTFNGSSSVGTPANAKGNGQATWTYASGPEDGAGGINQTDGSISSSASSVISSAFQLITSIPDIPAGFSLYVRMDSQLDTTITFTNTVYDYSGFDVPTKAYIESTLSGNPTMVLTGGTGFGNVTAVPEPGTYAFLLSLAVLGYCALRRKQSPSA